MKGELIEDAMTAFAGLGIGIGGHGIDAAAIGELKDAGGIADRIYDSQTGILEENIVDEREMFAFLEEETGLDFIAGGNPSVGLVAALAQAQDQSQSGYP